MSILPWNVPLISPILLKRSLVFPILLFCSTSLHCLLKKAFFFFSFFKYKFIYFNWRLITLQYCIGFAFLSLLNVLWNSAFSWMYLSLSLPFTSLLRSAICKASSKRRQPFCLLGFFFGMVLVTASCTKLQTSIHSSSGSLSDLIPWIYSLPPLYNHKGFDLSHTWMAYTTDTIYKQVTNENLLYSTENSPLCSVMT